MEIVSEMLPKEKYLKTKSGPSYRVDMCHALK